MFKSRFCLILCSALVAAMASFATAGEPQARVQRLGRYTLPRTHDFLLTSREGREYRLLVAEPDAEAPPEGFPVLYVLDANSCFGTVVESQRVQARRREKTGVAPQLIVGIGYPGDEPFDTVRRTLDYTIPADSEKLPPRRDGSDWPPHGGADAFLDFIETEVKPVIEGRFQVNRRRQAIFGHSFGGLFVLHTLFTRPDAFQGYIASSPSVWWNDYALLTEEKAFRERCRRSPVNIRLKVTRGELEKGRGPAAQLPATPSSTTFGGAKEMAARLGELEGRGITIEFEEIQNANHGSVIPVAINRGLRFASVADDDVPHGD